MVTHSGLQLHPLTALTFISFDDVNENGNNGNMAVKMTMVAVVRMGSLIIVTLG